MPPGRGVKVPTEVPPGVPPGDSSSIANPANANASSTGEVGPMRALAIARANLGDDEIRDTQKLSSFFTKAGIKVNPAVTPWCAAYVNASLAQAGMKGTGSLAAGSFVPQPGVKGWGSGVEAGQAVAAGDVGVVRGRTGRTNLEGTHVGFLTGERKIVGGREWVEMVGGNQGGTVSGKGGVSSQWRLRSSLHIRRAGEQEGARKVVDKAMSNQTANANVTARGSLNVNVIAPRGTTVKAQGDGAFTETNTNRVTPLNELAAG